MKTLPLWLSAFLLLGVAGSPALPPASPPCALAPRQAPLAGDLLTRLPLYFIENQGQVGPAARYCIQGRDRTIFFTSEGVIFRLAGVPAADLPPCIVTSQFAGADPAVRPEGMERAEMTVNYFTGSPEHWRAGLPACTSIVYHHLWPGIDLVWQGESGRLKQLFRVQPAADPAGIGRIYRDALGWLSSRMAAWR